MEIIINNLFSFCIGVSIVLLIGGIALNTTHGKFPCDCISNLNGKKWVERFCTIKKSFNYFIGLSAVYGFLGNI